MKFLNIYSPVWANESRTLVNVSIDTDTPETLLFTASPNDTTDYGPAIYQAALAGQFGEIVAYVAPVPTPEQVPAEPDLQS